MPKKFFVAHGSYDTYRNDLFWESFRAMKRKHEAELNALMPKLFVAAFVVAMLVLVFVPE